MEICLNLPSFAEFTSPPLFAALAIVTPVAVVDAAIPAVMPQIIAAPPTTGMTGIVSNVMVAKPLTAAPTLHAAVFPLLALLTLCKAALTVNDFACRRRHIPMANVSMFSAVSVCPCSVISAV